MLKRAGYLENCLGPGKRTAVYLLLVLRMNDVCIPLSMFAFDTVFS